MFPDFFQWIQDLWLPGLVRESIWGYPVVGAIHVVGFVWFGGVILVMNLRLCGWTLPTEPFDGIRVQLRAWSRAALATTLLSGLILFGAQPFRYSESLSFRIKMILLVLAGANALGVRLFLREPDPPRRWARCAGAVSLALWVLIVFASRGIAYF